MVNYNKIIHDLLTIDYNDNSQTGKIMKLLSQLRIPVVRCSAQEGYTITRARRGRGYRSANDMSYKPAILCTEYQRASLPYKTVFYGILSDDEYHLENARAIGISECSLLSNMGKESIGREYIANSHWRIVENIDVVCIVSANSYKNVNNNKLLENIKNDFLNCFSENEEALFVSDYVEREFSKQVTKGHSYEYKVSAMLADLLLNTYKFEAVAYPSVKLGGQAGLNLAIRPDIADSKLKLINIADQCYYKNSENGIVEIESIYDVVNDKVIKPMHSLTEIEICQKLGIDTIDVLPTIN